MKKRNTILLAVVIFASLLISCNDSVKGKWSESDIQNFHSDMKSVDEDLAVFGEKKGEWIECYLSKCEAKYSSYLDADSDEAGCEEIAIKCTEDILSIEGSEIEE